MMNAILKGLAGATLLAGVTLLSGCQAGGGGVTGTGNLQDKGRPIPAINAFPARGPNPLLVNFTSEGSKDPDGQIIRYEWDFDFDGRTFDVEAVGMTAQHTYFVAKTYIAALRVLDDRGNTGIDFIQITVEESFQQPPVAFGKARVGTNPFTTGPIAANIGQIVYFAGEGFDPDGGSVTYVWEFGDGGSAVIQNPTHIYRSAGDYFARLTVTDDELSTAVAILIIRVGAAGNQPPISDAKVSVDGQTFVDGPISAPTGALLFFRGIALDPENEDLTYTWDFGDGLKATERDTTHIYTIPGVYTVLLAARDPQGNSGSDRILVNIFTPGSPTVVAEASTDGRNYVRPPASISGPAPLSVYFRATGSDPQGQPLTFSWNFGDGTPEVAGSSVTHTYQTSGVYTATLRGTNPQGQFGTSTISVRVNAAPVAVILVDRATGDAPLAVNFDARSSFDPDGTITDYEWNFDYNPPQFAIDATGVQTQFTYTEVRTYVAALRVRDDSGQTSIATQIIAVLGNLPPTAVIVMRDASGNILPSPAVSQTVPFTVFFDGTNSDDPDGNIVSFTWDFDYSNEPCTAFTDTNGSGLRTGAQIQNTFTQVRLYRVALSVVDDLNSCDIATALVNAGNVVISPPVISNFGPVEVVIEDPDYQAGRKTVQFRATIVDPDGGYVATLWSFGDGAQGGGTNPTHTYDLTPLVTPGDKNFLASNFTISIQATDDEGDTTTVNFNMVMSALMPPAMLGQQPAPARGFQIITEAGDAFIYTPSSKLNRVITFHFCRMGSATNNVQMPTECQLSDDTLTPLWTNRNQFLGPLANDYEQYFIALDRLSPNDMLRWRTVNPTRILYPLLIDVDQNPVDGVTDAWAIYRRDPPWGDGVTDINEIPLTVVIDRNGYVRGWIPLPIVDVGGIPGAPPGIDSFLDIVIHLLKFYDPT
ncbi:MAG: PKD domain-containing protein [bacterium JZ-2024 1]